MFQGFYKNVRGSNFGRGMEAGFAEAFGYQRDAFWKGGSRHYEKGGFLGKNMALRKGETVKNFAGRQRGARIGNGIGLAALGISAFMGYQENGLMGAATNVARDVAFQSIGTGIYNAAVGAVGSVPLLIGAAVAGGAYGYYKLGEAGQKYSKKLRKLELGTDIDDSYGTISTMRQRSVMAIQNSYLNGRMALGNEASSMHMTYRL